MPAPHLPSPPPLPPARTLAHAWALQVFHDATIEGLQGLVLSQSAFYAEAGGQVADLGKISAGDAIFDVTDVKKFGPFVLHIGTMLAGSLRVGQEVPLPSSLFFLPFSCIPFSSQ